MFQVLSIYNFVLLLILNICGASEFRGHGRLFAKAHTSTVVESKVVTSLVPSSCVQVANTLPPCRNVRYLKFPKMPTLSFQNPASEEVVSRWRTEPKIETTSLGWGEYFGLYAPTVTVTTTDLRITTVYDPSVVVTYAVKGCRPLKLPLDLNRCPEEAPSSMSIEEVLRTSTVPSPIVATETLLPTKTMSVGSNPVSTVYEELPNYPGDFNLLEPSAEERAENALSQPTEAL